MSVSAAGKKPRARKRLKVWEGEVSSASGARREEA